MMHQPIEGQDLTISCWPLVHLSAVRDVRSSSQFRDDIWPAYWFPAVAFQTGITVANKILMMLSWH